MVVFIRGIVCAEIALKAREHFTVNFVELQNINMSYVYFFQNPIVFQNIAYAYSTQWNYGYD